jgi:dihydroflavonol-4-reductase
VKVLVTGATGFTGGQLARHLAAAGHVVRVLVRQSGQTAAWAAEGFDVAVGDLTDRPSLERAASDVAVIYNIAALYREAGRPASAYRAVNADGVVHVIEAAHGAGVGRVVHCSTVGVHGDIAHPPAAEDAPFKPGDIYQQTKLLGQIARGRFVMLGSGRNFYHLTYVTDLCEGFRLCGDVPAAAGGTYILGGGEVTTLADLVDITTEVSGSRGPRLRLPVWPVWLAGAACEFVCTPLGIAPPLYRRRVDFFRKSRAFDISRARRELGYAPVVGVRDGIGRTLEWYRAQGWI